MLNTVECCLLGYLSWACESSSVSALQFQYGFPWYGCFDKIRNNGKVEGETKSSETDKGELSE